MKKIFNKTALIALVAVSSLAASFRLARKPTYWQAEGGDVTVKVEPCIERGLCINIHTMNPDDQRVQNLAGYLRGVKPSRDVALSFCGHMLGTALQEKEDGSWDGTITSSKGHTAGLKVRSDEEGRLEARGYKLLSIIGKSFYFRAIEKPAPACKVPPEVKARIKKLRAVGYE